METKDNEQRPFSYHTFLLPFEIENENAEKLESETIVREILNSKVSYWKEIKENDRRDFVFNSVILTKNEEDKKKIIQAIAYNQKQYFHENVMEAIHNESSNVVREFVFRFQGTDERTCILKTLEEKKKREEKTYTSKEYILPVSNIRLKVFNTGICILILEMYNKDYRNIESVKEINALGRQVSLPFIALDTTKEPCKLDSTKILCAQEITWTFLPNPNDMEKTYSFEDKNDNFWEPDKPQEETYTMDLLSKLVIGKEKEPHYKLIPSIDDRMFTCSLIQDNDASEYFTRDYKVELEKVELEKYNEVSKSLYEYIYIDKEGGCTAPTFSFRKEILEASLYHRWTESRTIYGASHTSFVGIVNEGDFAETIVTRPFLTQYVEIAILVLAQRASILRFQKQITSDLDNKKIKDLQKKYINYRNQLHFFELTSQEQGIELYELIRKQLYIEKEMEELEKNLVIVYEKSNIDSANKYSLFGVIIGAIAILSIVLDSTSFILNTKAETSFCLQFCLSIYKIFGITLSTMFLWALLWRYINEKK